MRLYLLSVLLLAALAASKVVPRERGEKRRDKTFREGGVEFRYYTSNSGDSEEKRDRDRYRYDMKSSESGSDSDSRERLSSKLRRNRVRSSESADESSSDDSFERNRYRYYSDSDSGDSSDDRSGNARYFSKRKNNRRDWDSSNSESESSSGSKEGWDSDSRDWSLSKSDESRGSGSDSGSSSASSESKYGRFGSDSRDRSSSESSEEEWGSDSRSDSGSRSGESKYRKFGSYSRDESSSESDEEWSRNGWDSDSRDYSISESDERSRSRDSEDSDSSEWRKRRGGKLANRKGAGKGWNYYRSDSGSESGEVRQKRPYRYYSSESESRSIEERRGRKYASDSRSGSESGSGSKEGWDSDSRDWSLSESDESWERGSDSGSSSASGESRYRKSESDSESEESKRSYRYYGDSESDSSQSESESNERRFKEKLASKSDQFSGSYERPQHNMLDRWEESSSESDENVSPKRRYKGKATKARQSDSWDSESDSESSEDRAYRKNALTSSEDSDFESDEDFKGKKLRSPRNGKRRGKRTSSGDSAESWFPEHLPAKNRKRGGKRQQKREVEEVAPQPLSDDPRAEEDEVEIRTKRTKSKQKYHDDEMCIEVCGTSKKGKRDPCYCADGKVNCKNEDLDDADICLSDQFQRAQLADGKKFIVRELDLSHNAIAKLDKDFVLPEDNGTIEVIDLSRNGIYDIDDDAFRFFPKLRRLELNNNQLEDIFDDMFKGLKSLEFLDLHDNKIKELLDSPFKYLSNLQTLSLSGNPLTDIDESSFKGLDKLRALHLDDTELSMVHESWFQHLPNLELLTLKNNQFRIVPALHKFENLKTLDISGNPIQELPTNSFKDLNKLRSLVITYMPGLWYVDSCAFCGLPSLVELDMAHNKELAEIKEDAFGKDFEQVRIDTIDLSDNALTTLSMNLLPWENIDRIDFSNNPYVCDCDMSWVSEFGLAMPDRPICKSPDKFKGRYVDELDYKDFDCDHKELAPMRARGKLASRQATRQGGTSRAFVVSAVIVAVALFIGFMYFVVIRNRRSRLEAMRYKAVHTRPEQLPDPVEL